MGNNPHPGLAISIMARFLWRHIYLSESSLLKCSNGHYFWAERYSSIGAEGKLHFSWLAQIVLNGPAVILSKRKQITLLESEVFNDTGAVKKALPFRTKSSLFAHFRVGYNGGWAGLSVYGLWALIEINIKHWDADMPRWSASVQCFCRGGLWGRGPSLLDGCLHLLELN